jgi:GTP-binding protein
MKAAGAEYLTGAARPEDFPRQGAPEIAFLGRSNVGKSSLINRLVRRRELARTSRTPGKTRLLHWYRLARGGRELWLVDLPGYGYAACAWRCCSRTCAGT